MKAKIWRLKNQIAYTRTAGIGHIHAIFIDLHCKILPENHVDLNMESCGLHFVGKHKVIEMGTILK